MSIIQGISQTAAGGFDPELIGNSVWLDGSADYLTRQNGSAFTNRKEVILSFWIQRNEFSRQQAFFGGVESSAGFILQFDVSTDKLFLSDGGDKKTTAIYRDIGWYHILVSYDTSQAAANNRTQLYINGEQVTSFSTAGSVALNSDIPGISGQMTGSEVMRIGNYNNTVGNFYPFNGYIAQACMLESVSIQQGDYSVSDFLDTYTFGTNGSQFSPKSNADIAALATTAGGNSFCLDFANSSDLGNDISSNNNDFTPTSMAAANQSSSTPSLSYAALNILDKGSSATTSEGATRQPTGTDHVILSSMQIPTTGKWAISGRVDAGDFSFGICTQAHTRTSKIGRTNNSWGAIDAPGASFFRSEHDSVGSNSTSAVSAANDTFIIAFDADSGKLWLGRNDGGAGIAYLGGGNPATGATPTYTLSASEMSPGLHFAVGNRLTVSFGQRAHFETLPTDFLELNSANLTAPDYHGCDYFDAAIYEGTGSEQTVGSGGSDSKFTALAWIKNRDAADDNIWMDRVIGTGGYLSTTQNDSGTAATAYGDGGTDILTAEAQAVKTFGQRSVTIGTMPEVNTAGESYVLWQWLIGDSATSAASITAGSPSLSTTGLVAEPGHFSIVQYTGNGTDNATFAHGLGATPDLVMIKRRSGSATNSDWVLHVVGLGTENYIYPHYRIALASGAGANGMVPGADLVEISTGAATNTNGETHMAYIFRNTPGLFRVGTYVGNSSTVNYVSTGFKPRWIWIFNTTLTSADAERPIFDTARYKFNGSTTAGGSNGGVVFSDQRAAEEAQNTSLGVNPAIDILADGFALRANDSTINTNTTYLFLAMSDIASGAGLCPIYGR